MDDYSSAMTAAYTKANEAYQRAKKSGKQLEGRYSEALESCDAQENKSDWYKIATQLIPKLEKPAAASKGAQ